MEIQNNSATCWQCGSMIVGGEPRKFRKMLDESRRVLCRDCAASIPGELIDDDFFVDEACAAEQIDVAREAIEQNRAALSPADLVSWIVELLATLQNDGIPRDDALALMLRVEIDRAAAAAAELVNDASGDLAVDRRRLRELFGLQFLMRTSENVSGAAIVTARIARLQRQLRARQNWRALEGGAA